MKYLKALIMLMLCLTACTNKNQVSEMYMNLNKADNFISIEEEHYNEVTNLVANEYTIPQEAEKDIDEFEGMDVLFVKYTLGDSQISVTIYEDGYGYYVENDKVNYVKYNDEVFNKLKEYLK